MNLIDVSREAYRDLSRTLSTICRYLGFAGIALIWVFKIERTGVPSVPAGLMLPALFIVGSLTMDLLQYVVSTATWGLYARRLEIREARGADVPATAPRWFNWPAVVLFWLKIGLMTVAYILILRYVSQTVL